MKGKESLLCNFSFLLWLTFLQFFPTFRDFIINKYCLIYTLFSSYKNDIMKCKGKIGKYITFIKYIIICPHSTVEIIAKGWQRHLRVKSTHLYNLVFNFFSPKTNKIWIFSMTIHIYIWSGVWVSLTCHFNSVQIYFFFVSMNNIIPNLFKYHKYNSL